MTTEKTQLLQNAKRLRKSLSECGLETLGESHIVPVILGSNKRAVECSSFLIDNGYYLLPIRHPTVAPGSARVRISLRADIEYDELQNLPALIQQKMIEFYL